VLNFQTPLQVLSSHFPIPSVLNLPPKIFGCVAFVNIQKHQRSKLEPCAERCIFVGYGQHQKGYKCLNPTSKKLFVTMDVTFIETESFLILIILIQDIDYLTRSTEENLLSGIDQMRMVKESMQLVNL
jgi:hypothetical protein